MAMTNLYKELEDTLRYKDKTFDDILCADIYNEGIFKEDGEFCLRERPVLTIKVSDSPENKKEKLDLIKEFVYNSGYGSQEIFGLVWFKDGTWLERGEYDGSEWWEYKETPEIPESLK